jgi:class 3 adenylate cyclase
MERGASTTTILFTDLVGSTALRRRLGEEAAEELRRRHDVLVREAVEGHRGRVVKGLGDDVMADSPPPLPWRRMVARFSCVV